jgi:hypothetical protein
MNSSFSALNALLICSPAFVLFLVLDPQGAFRKEVLLFALLSTLCSRLVDSDIKISRGLPVYMGIACALIVLSHELLVVYLPYIICAFIIHDKDLSVNARKITVSIIPAMAIAIFLTIFGRGDKQVVINICNSLKPSAPIDCIDPNVAPGAISYIGDNIISAHSFVVASNNATTLLVYALTMILSFTPLVLMLFSKQFSEFPINKKMRFWLVICIGSAIIGSLPLSWVVADYGRLIYIHITCLSLLALMATQERNNMPLHLNFKQIIAWVLCFLFISSWRLIHWNASAENAFPFIAIFERFFN